MVSRYRHRRTSNPATAFPALVEPGEIVANTSNRQLAIGDADSGGTIGTPLALLVVRAFDARAQYATGDFVVQAGALYRAKAAITPGVFNAANWEKYDDTTTLKAYIDAADATLTNGKVAKAGDTMTGNLTITNAAPFLFVNKAASGQNAILRGSMNGVARWDVYLGDNAPEDASNNGSRFQIICRDNAGVVIGVALLGDRATGLLTVKADPTAALGVATKQYVDSADLLKADKTYVDAADALKAPLASPIFTGDPRAPTPTAGDNDTTLATTAFVSAAVAAAAPAAATAAEYRANSAPTKMLTPGAVWTASSYVNLMDGATVTPDFSAGIDFRLDLTGTGRTMANPTNTKIGQKGVIWLGQDATGNRTITTWGSAWKFPGGIKPTLSTAASSWDALTYVVLSSSFIACTFLADMK